MNPPFSTKNYRLDDFYTDHAWLTMEILTNKV